MHKYAFVGFLVVAVALVAARGSAGGGAQSGAPEGIVFERVGDLYAIAIDGSRTVRLTKTRAFEVEPAVSPDGQSIAFGLRGRRDYERARSPWTGSADDTGGDLWTMGLGGNRRTRLTQSTNDSDPAWSPAGDTIFFSRLVKGAYYEPCRAIFRVGSDGRGLRRLTRTIPGGRPDGELNPIDAPQDLAVSPDGLRVAFTDESTCETTDTSPNLEVIDTSGQFTDDLSRLPESSDEVGFADPTWSPDGSRIAFEGCRSICIARRDGSGRQRVTPKTLGDEPSWSPDGAWIAFVGNGDLYVSRPDGTGLRRLTRTKQRESSPAWLPRMPTG